jgi:hypothetical protein
MCLMGLQGACRVYSEAMTVDFSSSIAKDVTGVLHGKHNAMTTQVSTHIVDVRLKSYGKWQNKHALISTWKSCFPDALRNCCIKLITSKDSSRYTIRF